MASVGKHIRRLRTERNLTQEQLAEKLFVTRQAVSAWETGKAHPDVETLERIAAALDVDMTEIIYGVPQSPNLQTVKRRWALIGGSAIAVLALTLIILMENGSWGTWRHGLQYQFFNSNYHLSYQEIPGTFSVELDLMDLDSNTGKILYQDDSGCRVIIDAVDNPSEDEYRVWFRARGSYNRKGGALVSGCQSILVDKTHWSFQMESAMTATVDGIAYPCSAAGSSGLLWKDGNQFGFHLNPYREGDRHNLSLENMDTITIAVSGLSLCSTHRSAYWNIY